MKFFNSFKSEPNSVLVFSLEKISRGLFVSGLFVSGLLTGISLIMALINVKENDWNSTLLLLLSTTFFLLLSILFLYRLTKNLLPEINRRLNSDK